MSDVVIRVENLSKQYRLGEVSTNTISHDLNRWWAKVRGKEDPFLKVGETKDRTRKGDSDYVWALRDINFEVKRGEVLGIIGRNGAGKSTLLKILSKTTTPTTGAIKLKGRIASLLEVGTGFHPEMTGRENVFLNGTILGMTQREIKSKFDEIVDFAGVERYIDTPVKRYSSGMYVRLAFAVAAHLEPEILIVDEVLAVGDAEFQKKCLGKMKDVSVNDGRTVLFVSHNMQAISTITTSSLLMANGRNIFYGSTYDTISEYLKAAANRDLAFSAAPRSDKATITSVSLKTSEANNTQINGESMEIHIAIHCSHIIKGAGIACQILNDYDQSIVHSWLFDPEDKPLIAKTGMVNLICTFPKFRLYMGKYFLNIYLAENFGKEMLDTVQNICPFEVTMYKKDREYDWEPNSCMYIEEFCWNLS